MTFLLYGPGWCASTRLAFRISGMWEDNTYNVHFFDSSRNIDVVGYLSCFLCVWFLARQGTASRSMINLYIETLRTRHIQVVHTGRRLAGPRLCVIRCSRKSSFLRLRVDLDEKIILELKKKQPAVTTPKPQESLELVLPSFFAGPLKYFNIEKIRRV